MKTERVWPRNTLILLLFIGLLLVKGLLCGDFQDAWPKPVHIIGSGLRVNVSVGTSEVVEDMALDMNYYPFRKRLQGSLRMGEKSADNSYIQIQQQIMLHGLPLYQGEFSNYGGFVHNQQDWRSGWPKTIYMTRDFGVIVFVNDEAGNDFTVFGDMALWQAWAS